MKRNVEGRINRKERAFIALYHWLEELDGEHGGHAVLPYQYAEPLKLACLRQIEEAR